MVSLGSVRISPCSDVREHRLELVDGVEHVVHQVRRHRHLTRPNRVEQVLDGVREVARLLEPHRARVPLQRVGHAEDAVHRLLVARLALELEQRVVQLGDVLVGLLHEVAYVLIHGS
jgi:hypothetical protein